MNFTLLSCLALAATLADAAALAAPTCAPVPSNCHVNDNGGNLPHTICNRPGSVSRGVKLSVCRTDTFNDCVNQCYQNSACKSISYGGTAGTLCQLWKRTPAAMGFTDGSSSSPVFSNINCFFESCFGGAS